MLSLAFRSPLWRMRRSCRRKSIKLWPTGLRSHNVVEKRRISTTISRSRRRRSKSGRQNSMKTKVKLIRRSTKLFTIRWLRWNRASGRRKKRPMQQIRWTGRRRPSWSWVSFLARPSSQAAARRSWMRFRWEARKRRPSSSGWVHRLRPSRKAKMPLSTLSCNLWAWIEPTAISIIYLLTLRIVARYFWESILASIYSIFCDTPIENTYIR